MILYDTEKTYALIDLDALAANYRTAVKKAKGAAVFAVVKADAYGHGALAAAHRLEKEGCPGYCVSNVNEALELRDGNVKGMILVLGYVLDGTLAAAVENGISLAVDTPAHLQAIADAAAGREARVHLKLGTGMNRTGFDVSADSFPAELAKAAEILRAHPNLAVEGVFSHFAMADEPDGGDFTHLQYARFSAAVRELEAHGVHPKYRHIANSAGIEHFPETHGNAVRMGITLYGGTKDEGYRGVMSFFTSVVNVHMLRAGESVSYGLTYTAPCDRVIAVIGAGYADGFFRSLSGGKGVVMIRGREAPVLGRVCMDMTMVDVTDIPGVKPGDRVLLFGKDGSAELPATRQAANAGTISYELLCAVSKRVPRKYLPQA